MNLIDLLDNLKIPDAEDESQARKVIVWGQDNLLARAIDQILAMHLTWEITRMVNNDSECLLQTVDIIKPDVVVLCHVDMEDLSLAFHVLSIQPEIRVITVGLENNVVNVYSRQQFVLRCGSDFISVVDGSYFSNTPSTGGESKETVH